MKFNFKTINSDFFLLKLNKEISSKRKKWYALYLNPLQPITTMKTIVYYGHHSDRDRCGDHTVFSQRL